MTKKSLIILVIIAFFTTLTALLFGVVFCVRNQSVNIVDKTILLVDNNEIIKTAGIDNGASIFLINKQEAINKIEARYPHIKVVQIKTTGLTSIEFCVRTRYSMYYAEANNKYYIMDEDLKVLKILETNPETIADNLIKIKSAEIEIPSTTKVCDFVGTSQQKHVVYQLFVAMYTSVCKPGLKDEAYLTRDEIKQTITEIDFENKASYDKLIITTSYGVMLDIENPEDNLQGKINICFSTINKFIELGNNNEKNGTIKIFFDENKEMKCVYIPSV